MVHPINKDRWAWICLTYATFRVELDDNDKITWTSSIAYWTKGKKLSYCLNYWKRKNQLIDCKVFVDGTEECQPRQGMG